MTQSFSGHFTGRVSFTISESALDARLYPSFAVSTQRPAHRLDLLRKLAAAELALFLSENVHHLAEDEALAVLQNPYATPKVCQMIAQNVRLSAFYSVRMRLVAHRQTPLVHSVKLVHYLYWPDLVRLSIEVTVPAQVRRAIDTLLLTRVAKLSLGEKISSAKRCSSALIRVFLFESDPRVFAALLVNQRVREDDLILLAGSPDATVEQLVMLSSDRKWSSRYAIRRALVLNSRTPRAVAASQIRFLSRRDLRQIHENPATSTYIRRCIERSPRMSAQLKPRRSSEDEPDSESAGSAEN